VPQSVLLPPPLLLLTRHLCSFRHLFIPSCVVPTTQTLIKTLYVFVEISIDSTHLVSTVRSAFPSSKDAFARGVLAIGRAGLGAAVDTKEVEERLVTETNRPGKGKGKEVEVSKGLIEVEASGGGQGKAVSDDGVRPTKLALVSTIQFVAAVQTLKDELAQALPPLEPDEGEEDGLEAGEEGAMVHLKSRMVGLVDQTKLWRGKYEIIVPQTKPLSPGEILGCTAPKLGEDVDALMYVHFPRLYSSRPV
jgi:2-(3-amino-3-carboxypropyl)histidine synthase